MNFIDKILAREEAHRLVDYKICLELIDRLLRQRNPYEEPERMLDARSTPSSTTRWRAAVRLAGWDYSRYGNPRFFLQLLRRHTLHRRLLAPEAWRQRRRRRLGLPGEQPASIRLTGALPDAVSEHRVAFRLGARARNAARPQSRISTAEARASGRWQHAGSQVFDVVIIGSGAGGAPIAHTLVNAGKSVLVLEKGRSSGRRATIRSGSATTSATS